MNLQIFIGFLTSLVLAALIVYRIDQLEKRIGAKIAEIDKRHRATVEALDVHIASVIDFIRITRSPRQP